MDARPPVIARLLLFGFALMFGGCRVGEGEAVREVAVDVTVAATAMPSPFPSPASPPQPAAMPSPGPAAITGVMDLTGRSAAETRGILVAAPAIITSTIDAHTKKDDVYAIELMSGQTLTVQLSSAKAVLLWFGGPGAKDTGREGWRFICGGAQCSGSYTARAAGKYYIGIETNDVNVRYSIIVIVQ